MEKQLKLTGVGNARELGGYAIGDKTIKHDLLLRTASLAKLSDKDQDVLETHYRVATVIDLRMSPEREASPDTRLNGADNVFLPVLEAGDYPNYNEKTAKLLSDPNAERFEVMKNVATIGMLSENLYVDFLFSNRGLSAYRTLFECLLEVPGGHAFLWHCTDGKDRTGVAAMLILTALGADRDTIFHDYMLTNEFNREKVAAAEAVIAEKQLPPDMREIMLFGAGAVNEKYMENALTAMNERCGSPMAYLEQELGVGEAEREELRLKFLE